MGTQFQSSTGSVDNHIYKTQTINLSSPLPSNQIAVLATHMTDGSYSCTMLSSSSMSVVSFSGSISVTAISTTQLKIQHSVFYTATAHGSSGSGTIIAKANNVTWKILLGFYI